MYISLRAFTETILYLLEFLRIIIVSNFSTCVEDMEKIYILYVNLLTLAF